MYVTHGPGITAPHVDGCSAGTKLPAGTPGLLGQHPPPHDYHMI